MTPLREGQQAQGGIIGCTINYLPYFRWHSIDFWHTSSLKETTCSCLLYRYEERAWASATLLSYDFFSWTLSHWICWKWVHVQLWGVFGIIMLLPGFLYIFPWDFLGMG
jgi:hypothetical protein